MSFKGPVKIVIIASTINAYICIKTLGNFLIQSMENWFGDDEFIFRAIMILYNKSVNSCAKK